MAAGDRSITEVFQNIIGNVQDIVRSEVRLVKTDVKIEVREEAARVKAPAVLVAAGSAAALFSTLFLLLAAVYALELVLPNWAAALIVGATLAVVASFVLSAGVKRFQQLYAAPKNTVEITTKENVEWAKQRTK